MWKSTVEWPQLKFQSARYTTLEKWNKYTKNQSFTSKSGMMKEPKEFNQYFSDLNFSWGQMKWFIKEKCWDWRRMSTLNLPSKNFKINQTNFYFNSLHKRKNILISKDSWKNTTLGKNTAL